MGFPAAPPVQEESFLQKLQRAMIGGGDSYGGMLDESAQKAAKQQAMMAMAAQLMQAGGTFDRRIGFGEALGSGIMAGQQARQGAEQQALQAMLLKSQLNQKERKRPTAVMGPNGQPIFVDEQEAIGKQPYMKPGSEYGAYQPGDYTPESWAKFIKAKDPAVLERYSTPRQEFSPSFQNVTKTLPNGATQQGTFNTRTGQYNWAGEVVPPGQKARVETEARTEAEITATREAKAPIAYATYQAGVKALEDALSKTTTGPVMGRIPAVTANQQTAEGGVATMAPVLKELFRSAGEGTFTEGDQAILMKMVPTRTDHPEARKAKLEMIDGIVRAKLGVADGATSRSKTHSFATEADAEAAGLKPGTRVIIGGVPGTWQ